MLNNSKFGIILLCLKDQLCAIAGVAQNSACWISFVCEGAGIGPCNLEILEIHVILVKSMDFMGSLDE